MLIHSTCTYRVQRPGAFKYYARGGGVAVTPVFKYNLTVRVGVRVAALENLGGGGGSPAENILIVATNTAL